MEEFAWNYGLLDVVLSIEFRGISKREEIRITTLH